MSTCKGDHIEPIAEGSGGILVKRTRGDGVELGLVKPLQHGRPITGELLTTAPCPTREGVLEVEPVAISHGPPQVATPAFRRGWDATFGPKGDLN